MYHRLHNRVGMHFLPVPPSRSTRGSSGTSPCLNTMQASLLEARATPFYCDATKCILGRPDVGTVKLRAPLLCIRHFQQARSYIHQFEWPSRAQRALSGGTALELVRGPRSCARLSSLSPSRTGISRPRPGAGLRHDAASELTCGATLGPVGFLGAKDPWWAR